MSAKPLLPIALWEHRSHPLPYADILGLQMDCSKSNWVSLPAKK